MVVSGMEARRVWDADRNLRARRNLFFAWRKVMRCNLVDAGVGGRREAYLTGPAFLRFGDAAGAGRAGHGEACTSETVARTEAATKTDGEIGAGGG